MMKSSFSISKRENKLSLYLKFGGNLFDINVDGFIKEIRDPSMFDITIK